MRKVKSVEAVTIRLTGTVTIRRGLRARPVSLVTLLQHGKFYLIVGDGRRSIGPFRVTPDV